MKATAKFAWGDTSLEGRHVVVSGVGKVGSNLVRHLVEQRAKVTIADVNQDALMTVSKDFDVATTPVDGAHRLPCDIYSPCALGAVLNEKTIPELACAAVVGSANNQLAEPSCAALLAGRGIVYAPDYVVNAGGVINIAEELIGYHRERAYAQVRRIYDTTLRVLETARAEGSTTAETADRLAERRIAEIGRVRLLRTGASSEPR
jgi:glutamate dehydrogenase/leucine dehydrogenase